jgi:hypothetical protein
MESTRRGLRRYALAAIPLALLGGQSAQAATSGRQQYVQLFGPVQNEGSLVETVIKFAPNYQPGAWVMPGAATSTSCKKFWFDHAWQSISWCSFRFEWRPGSVDNGVRLFAADDGIKNITELAHVDGSAYPPARVDQPDVGAVDVTAAMQALARAGVPKQIGWQVRGGAEAQPLQVWQVYLEILD